MNLHIVMIFNMFNLFYYLIVFVIAIFFIILGVIGIILPWSTGLRTEIIEFILANSIAISLFGFGFVVLGGTIVLNLIVNSKRKYYHMHVGSHLVTIDETIIQRYLQTYWEKLFPTQEVLMRLVIKKDKIKITADLPHATPEEQSEYKQRIKQDLREIFTKVLGYPHEFMLSLSFQTKNK